MRSGSLASFCLGLAAMMAVIQPGLYGDPALTRGVASPEITTASIGDAVVLPAASGPIAASGAARPIAAWLTFCRTYPGECDVNPLEEDTIRLTPAAWRQINDVNRAVNGAIRPLTDMEHWNVIDRWDFAEDGYGDCEDYQLLKRRRLAELGFPRRAMVVTVVLDERNEGHAVLMVRTDRGDLILDNKRNDVLPWQRTPYVYVKRESQRETGWVSLNHVSAVASTAAR